MFEKRELIERLQKVQEKAQLMIGDAIDSAKKKNLIDVERETHDLVHSLLLLLQGDTNENAIYRAEEFLSLITL